MRHVSDADVEALLDPGDVERLLVEAFRSFGEGRAAIQERVRSVAGAVKLSTLGAVLPDQGFAGAKVYTTIGGQFRFVIVLFDAVDGAPLATFDAGAITRLRTAATSVIASRYLARPDVRRMALFGAGVQGRAHAIRMAGAYALDEIRVRSRSADATLCAAIEAECGVAVRPCGAAEALADAEIVVTASRARTPLFSGDLLAPGAFVAAIGSSLPDTRELDDRALERASTVAVDWSQQALREAGDLVLADPNVLQGKVVQLSDLVTGAAVGRRDADEITVFKSVGIGLQDVALAGLAWRRLSQAAGSRSGSGR